MACENRSKVYLGFEDEYVTEKHRSLVNFTTNKIGGKPDAHDEKFVVPNPRCKLCGIQQLLALQVYAPLENSRYHRTLYIFVCINPNCWNQNDSWTCLRVQSLEEKTITNTTDNCGLTTVPTTSWLSGADDWDEETNDNISEQNGNNVFANEQSIATKTMEIGEKDLNRDMSNLEIDDPNANSPTSIESLVGGGAVGRLDSPLASAEIEGEESEVVCIDTPTEPQCDLMNLLHEVTPLPHSESNGHVNLTFVEVFMSVEDEDLSVDVPQHVRDLFVEYQMCNPEVPINSGARTDDLKGIETTPEKYEKSVPMHGDEMFHNFLSRIQKNPGQILRYCRDNTAVLLLSPLGENIGSCVHCGADRIFELQVLSTIIPKLRLHPSNGRNFEIEFGTVLIFTCSRSCWSTHDLYKNEYVIVQAERL